MSSFMGGRLIAKFAEICQERMETLNTHLLILVGDPDNQEAIASIFEEVQALQGESGMLNLMDFHDLVLELDAVLRWGNEQRFEVHSQFFELVFSGVELVNAFVDAGLHEVSVELTDVATSYSGRARAWLSNPVHPPKPPPPIETPPVPVPRVVDPMRAQLVALFGSLTKKRIVSLRDIVTSLQSVPRPELIPQAIREIESVRSEASILGLTSVSYVAAHIEMLMLWLSARYFQGPGQAFNGIAVGLELLDDMTSFPLGEEATDFEGDAEDFQFGVSEWLKENESVPIPARPSWLEAPKIEEELPLEESDSVEEESDSVEDDLPEEDTEDVMPDWLKASPTEEREISFSEPESPEPVLDPHPEGMGTRGPFSVQWPPEFLEAVEGLEGPEEPETEEQSHSEAFLASEETPVETTVSSADDSAERAFSLLAELNAAMSSNDEMQPVPMSPEDPEPIMDVPPWTALEREPELVEDPLDTAPVEPVEPVPTPEPEWIAEEEIYDALDLTDPVYEPADASQETREPEASPESTLSFETTVSREPVRVSTPEDEPFNDETDLGDEAAVDGVFEPLIHPEVQTEMAPDSSVESDVPSDLEPPVEAPSVEAPSVEATVDGAEVYELTVEGDEAFEVPSRDVEEQILLASLQGDLDDAEEEDFIFEAEAVQPSSPTVPQVMSLNIGVERIDDMTRMGGALRLNQSRNQDDIQVLGRIGQDWSERLIQIRGLGHRFETEVTAQHPVEDAAQPFDDAVAVMESMRGKLMSKLERMEESAFTSRQSLNDLQSEIQAVHGLDAPEWFRAHPEARFAWTHLLIVEIPEGVFGFSVHRVEEVLSVNARDVVEIGEGEALILDETRRVPLVGLGSILGYGEEVSDDTVSTPVVVVETEGRLWGIRVNKVMGQRQVVQQVAEPFLGGIKMISGTAVIEEGQIVTCLGIEETVQFASQHRQRLSKGVGTSTPSP